MGQDRLSLSPSFSSRPSQGALRAPVDPVQSRPGPLPLPRFTALQSRGVRKPELHPGSCLSLPAHKTLPTSAPSRKAAIPVSPPGRCGGPREA